MWIEGMVVYMIREMVYIYKAMLICTIFVRVASVSKYCLQLVPVRLTPSKKHQKRLTQTNEWIPFNIFLGFW